MRRFAIAAAVLALLAAAALVLLPSELYEVVDKGRGPGIVPYESGLIFKVRLFDSLTLYAPDEARPDPDKLTSLALAAAATMTLVTYVLLRVAHGDPRKQRFFAWATAGLALLTIDETLAVHELIGHNMHFLGDIPGVERPDDLIFAIYPLAAGVFAWRYRDILFAQARTLLLFAVGGFFLLIAVAGDLLGSHVDEAAEPLAGLCLVAGLVLITADALRRELRLDELAPARPRAAAAPATWRDSRNVPVAGAPPAPR
jgi:hypothetical protein